MNHVLRVLLPLVVAAWALPSCEPGDEANPAKARKTAQSAEDAGTDFMRFVQDEDGACRLESGLVNYVDDEGRTVALVGAVHIGDHDYFEELNALFSHFDAVLYELVAERGSVPDPGQKSASGVSVLQRMMKDALDLEFQLDVVDYHAKNFVHADISPRRFAELMKEKGETLFTMMFKVALAEYRRKAADPDAAARDDPMAILLAFAAPDSARALKILLGRQFEDMEAMANSFEAGAGGEGSVIVGERNKACFDVLDEQLEAGKKRLAIFYGAAHLPNMEQRLFARGFKKRSEDWLTAWNIPAPPKAKKPETDH